MRELIWILTLFPIVISNIQSMGYVELSTRPTTLSSCLRPQTMIFSIQDKIKVWNTTSSNYLGTFRSSSIQGQIVMLKCRIIPYTSKKYHYVVVVDSYNNVVVWQESFNTISGKYSFTQISTINPSKQVYDISVSPSYIALNYKQQIQIFHNNLLNSSLLIPLQKEALDIEFDSNNNLYVMYTNLIQQYVNFQVSKTLSIQNYVLLDFQILKGSESQMIVRTTYESLLIHSLNKSFSVLPLYSKHKIQGWKSDILLYLSLENTFTLYNDSDKSFTDLQIDNVSLFQCSYSSEEIGFIVASYKDGKYVIQQYLEVDEDQGSILAIILWIACFCFQCCLRGAKGIGDCCRGGCCDCCQNLGHCLFKVGRATLNLFCLFPTEKTFDEIEQELK